MTDDVMKRAVLAQFSSRPTLSSVVANLLAKNLQAKYPPLTSPITQLRLALPREGGGRDLNPLLDVALRFIATGDYPAPVANSQLDAYLSDASGTRLTFDAGGPRDYNLEGVETLIRELRLIVPIVFQDALTAYWNAPGSTGASRWQWFADVLQGQLRSSAIRQLADDTAALQVLAGLADYPARETRVQRQGPEHSVHAYSVETCLAHGDMRLTVQASDILVVNGSQVLLYGVSGRIESFNNLDAFGEAWGQRMAERFVADSLTWQLYEPDGNIFEVQAGLLLNAQLDDLAAVDLNCATDPNRLEALFNAITDPTAHVDDPAPSTPQPLAEVTAALPDWLQQAPAPLRFAYRRCLLEQASARRLEGGKGWLEGLYDIRTYTRLHLNNQMCLTRSASLSGQRVCDAENPKYQADKLELTFQVPVGTLSGGYIEPVRMSLVDLALKNLSGKPQGRMTLRDTDGQALEDWLTPAYVEQLVQRVDIGLNYPTYIRQQLLGDTDEARQRKRLFMVQRPLELKSQALERAIRQQGNLSATGAAYVGAALGASRAERCIDNDEIVMRHLAFQRKPGAKADVAQNMFIIEPRNGQPGPRLLYRPAYRECLLEFSSREQLMAAIARPGEVQDSVLAWLDDSARVIYSNGGFIEPHYVRISGIGSEFDPLPDVPKPATLAETGDASNDEVLKSLTNGQLMEYLYVSEARQLLEQADRAATSNAESRWALILEGAQLGFNTLLMLARGPLAVVGWFVQLAQSLVQDVPALASGDPVTRELAWVDLLLNTAMVLVHQASGRETPARPALDADGYRDSLARLPLRRAAGLRAETPPSIKRGAFGLPAEPPGGGRTLLDFDHSLASDSAAARMLEKLLPMKAPWPSPLPEPVAIGALKGLYKIDGVWHAAVGGLFFRVAIVPGFAEVFIVHPDKPDHPGIKLKTDGQGHWTLDRGLKLVGGGPKRLAALREANQRKTQELLGRMQALGEEITPPMHEFNASLSRMNTASDKLIKQANTLKQVWTQLENADALQRPALETRHQREMHSYAKLRTEYQILLDTLEERFNALLPKRLELVEVGRELEKSAGARGHVQDRVKTLQTLWEHQFSLHTYLRYWADTLRITDRGEPMPHLITRMLLDRWLGDPTAYNEHVAKSIEMSDIQQRMATLSEAMETTLDQLEQDSVAGRAIRDTLLAKIIHPQYFFAKSLKLNALIPLSWVAVEPVEPGYRASPQEALYASHLKSEDLTQALLSHIEVRSSADYALAKQRQVYDTALDLYRRYEQAARALKTIQPQRLHTVSERLLDALVEARQLAENELESVVRRQEALELAQPLSKNLRPKAANKRVFKTRRQRYFVGDFKPASASGDHARIVLTDAMTGATVATYDQQPDGWTEAVEQPSTPPEPAPAPPTHSLATLKSQGQELISQRQAIERLINTQQQKLQSPLTRQDVNPADWDELLSGQAARLDAVAEQLTRDYPDNPTAQAAIDDFKANARDMQRMAQRVTSAAYKQQWPTLQAIDYLWSHGEIDINLTSQAAPQRPTLKGDFFTEYAVYDKAGKPPVVLWYAHFHYAKADAPPKAYTRAHLKLPEQRKFTQKDLLKQHVQDYLHRRQEPGAEPLGKILYVPIVAPQDALFLKITST